MDIVNTTTLKSQHTTPIATHSKVETTMPAQHSFIAKKSHITVPQRHSASLRLSRKKTSLKQLNRHSTQVLQQPQRHSQTSQSLSRSQATLSNKKISTITEQTQKRLTIAPSNLENQPSTNAQSITTNLLNGLPVVQFPEKKEKADQNQNTHSTDANNNCNTLFLPAASEKESNGNILIMTAISYKENDKTNGGKQNDNKLVSANVKNDISTDSLESSEESQSSSSNFTFTTNRKLTTFGDIMPTQIENTVQSAQSSQASQLSLLTNQALTTSSIQNEDKTKETDEPISVKNEEETQQTEEILSQNPVEETQEPQTTQEHGKLYTAVSNMAKFVKEHPIAVVAGTCTLAASIYFGTAGIQQLGTFASSQWQKLLAMISTIMPK